MGQVLGTENVPHFEDGKCTPLVRRYYIFNKKLEFSSVARVRIWVRFPYPELGTLFKQIFQIFGIPWSQKKGNTSHRYKCAGRGDNQPMERACGRDTSASSTKQEGGVCFKQKPSRKRWLGQGIGRVSQEIVACMLQSCVVGGSYGFPSFGSRLAPRRHCRQKLCRALCRRCALTPSIDTCRHHVDCFAIGLGCGWSLSGLQGQLHVSPAPPPFLRTPDVRYFRFVF